MPDAVKTVGQAVKQEAANELVGVQGHDLLGIAMPVITPVEADGSVCNADKAAVRDRDTVGVPTEVRNDMRG